MITSFALALSITLAQASDTPLVCPIMGGAAKAGATSVEYAGATYNFCCAGCDVKFAKEPAKYVKELAKDGKTAGAFLFDPVTKLRIQPKDAKATADYQGVRYYFSSVENKATFVKDTKKLAAVPAKESLVCSVMGSKIASYSKAVSYVDYKNVRYFQCCAGCMPKMVEDPEKYAGKHLQTPGAITLTN